MQQTVISEMGLGKTALRLEDPCENQSSEMKLDTKTELPKTEQLIHKPSMEQKSNKEEQSSQENDFPDTVSEVVSPEYSSNHSYPMGILYNEELDYLEVQKLNNIMKAAYKEFMKIAMEAKAWVCHPPAVGSIEDLQKMFFTPPPHGSTVECTVQSGVFPITSHFLTSIMMDAEIWASMFSNIICDGSHEDVLTPLKEFWRSEPAETAEVILVHAQFRLPAGYLPRWSTSFLRFKRRVDESTDTWAIFDVSTDYFEDAIIDPTQRIEYKRRPSGVIIRQTLPGLSQVIWVENAVVREINNPTYMCSTFNSNFPLTAAHWLSMLFHNLNRTRNSKVLTTEMFNKPQDILHLLVIGENLRRDFIQTVNPFPTERVCDLFSDDEIRILRDMKAHSNDYIASSTIYIPETPLKILLLLEKTNVELQWSSMEYPAQAKMAAGLHSEDDSNFVHLYAKIGKRVVQGNEFFLQEISMNEFCSFVLSTQMSEADARLALSPRFCKGSLFLRPTGFAIMPAGPGGLLSKASFVTICVRQKLECMEVDQVIEAMRSCMDAIIYQITPFESSNTNNDSKPKTIDLMRDRI